LKLKIGCDVDGVFMDCGNHVIDFNKKLGVLPESARASDCVGSFEETWPDINLSCFQDRRWWRDMPPIPGELEQIKKLLEIAEVWFISACSCPEGRLDSFKDHGISGSSGFRGFLQANPQEKPGVALDLGLQAVIEDRADTAAALARFLPRSYLVARPYNAPPGRLSPASYTARQGLRRIDLRLYRGPLSAIVSDLAENWSLEFF
jgi:hypothetical protein